MMSTQTTSPANRPGSSGSRRRRVVPLTLVVLGAVAAGAVTAALLVLVVFPGATESVVTGSMLTGFGFGWALMAVLSARMTTQPQRWAAVPAAAMGATGLVLMVTAPQNSALTTLNWVWPPVLLALVVWMFVSMRRSLTGRGRWVITPMLVVLAASTVGATIENFAEQSTQDTYPAPGKLYSVGDHRLHLDCRGEGGPTVVLFNGLGELSASWAWITDQVGTTTRVCAYDRASQGWSDDVDTPQDGVAAAEDLHRLLAAADEQGPFVLAGHSIGGPYALVYAERYPQQVAGMVLLDSSSPEQMTKVAGYAGQYAVMRRGLALFPTLVRVGLGRLFAAGAGLPAEDVARADAMTSTARALRNGRDEVSTIPVLFEQSQALTTLGDRPLVVLTTSENLGKMGGWRAAQDKLAGLSSNSVQRDVESTHAGLVSDQGPAAESARAITQVVTAVRTRSSLD